jgi:hypothetical protein
MPQFVALCLQFSDASTEVAEHGQLVSKCADSFSISDAPFYKQMMMRDTFF